jgi:hypothetical protein
MSRKRKTVNNSSDEHSQMVIMAENLDEDEETIDNAAHNETRRRRSFREVALRRAAHFARREEENPIHSQSNNNPTTINLHKASSTPFGVFVPSSNPATAGEGEVWPGPFSTAFELLEKREEAKQAREKAILLSQEDKSIENFDENIEKDKYDAYLENISIKVDTTAFYDEANQEFANVISLNDLCLHVIVKNFDMIKNLDLSCLSSSCRAKLVTVVLHSFSIILIII